MFKELLLMVCASFLNQENFRMADTIWKGVNPNLLSKESRLNYDYYGMCLGVYRNEKDVAKKHAVAILNSFNEVPVRYEAMASIVMLDTDHWQKGDMGNLGRNMSNVKRDLKSGYADKIVEMREKEILDQLDEMIKKEEDKLKPKDTPSQGSIGKVSPMPLPDSVISNESGKGEVEMKKLQELAGSWGKMPEKERARAIIELTKQYPARYRVVIEEYFKSLSK